MMTRVCALAAGILAASAISVAAEETCGGIYRVRAGDSLSLIADRLYKDVGMWTAIYRNNIDEISSPDAIRVGQVYRMPCISGLPLGLEGGLPLSDAALADAAPQTAGAQLADRQAASARRRAGVDVTLVAGDGFRPFTNRLQMSSGLITDIVNRAFVATDDVGLHKFHWVNDRSVHLDPMLSEGMVDLAFPWKKPDCAAAPETPLCSDYVYSDPMFEMLIVLFTAKDRPIRFDGNADLAGLRICSPRGYQRAALEGPGQGLLAEAGAMLMQPPTSEECFRRLEDGTADAVALNEFTGRVVLKDMGLSDRVEIMLKRPLSIEGLHVVAHRSNPRAEEIIAAFNDGLASIRESGEYLRVLDKHMSSIWAGL